MAEHVALLLRLFQQCLLLLLNDILVRRTQGRCREGCCNETAQQKPIPGRGQTRHQKLRFLKCCEIKCNDLQSDVHLIFTFIRYLRRKFSLHDLKLTFTLNTKYCSIDLMHAASSGFFTQPGHMVGLSLFVDSGFE
ncbi:hypothetical protein WM003_22775 [Klebsiella michiganensis]